jgi:hypothetical protein
MSNTMTDLSGKQVPIPAGAKVVPLNKIPPPPPGYTLDQPVPSGWTPVNEEALRLGWTPVREPIPPPPPGFTLDPAPAGDDWFAQNAPPPNKPPQTMTDLHGNQVPIPAGARVVPLQEDWFAANAPGVNRPTTIGPQHKTTAGDVLQEVGRIPTDPLGVIGDALDTVTNAIENYNQQGREEHPVLSHIGDVTRSAKELLFGGQEAGKPMGTRSGVMNNPVTTAMSLAPAAADLAEAGTARLGKYLASREARAARYHDA